MNEINEKKLLEIHVLCSITKDGKKYLPIKNIVESKMNKSINDNQLKEIISGLISSRFLEDKSGYLYPKYDYEIALSEVACLALEIWGPLQLRDLSTYIKSQISENMNITKIEGIIKAARHIRIYAPTIYDAQKISNLYLLPEQLESVGIRVREYKDPRMRFELRRKMGILSGEELKKGIKIIEKELKERGPIEVENLLAFIEGSKHIKGKMKKKINLQEKDGELGALKRHLHESIWSFLRSKGINELYSHQTKAIENIVSHNNVVVSTSAASGKTFIYMLPIINILIDNPNATFLYIAPTKSLAQDQKNKFNELSSNILGKKIAKNFDGHTPKEERKKILKKIPNVIVTNEHMLHYVILPDHEKWKKFFSDLEIVIIDEIHWYKGVFGSHVSNIFRRLNIISALYNSYPQYVGLSATIGNPKEFAEKLTGKRIVVIDEDGTPKYKKILVLFEPNIEDGSGFSDSAQIIAEHVASHLMVLYFGRSRNMVEMMTKTVRERLEPKLREFVASYRAGLIRDDRREIEGKFFDGKIRALNSTSAMELGIDVGDLDTVIIFGYPGSISSFWQRANRAGRRNKTSLVFYIPMDNPLDQFFFQNPTELLKDKFESALINPDNENIVEQHIKCLIDEIGRDFLEEFQKRYQMEFFNNLERFIETSLSHPALINEKAGISLNPQWDISLRSSSNECIKIYRDRKEIGETDGTRAPKELFPGAIYMAQGEKFLVKDLSFADKKAYVKYYPLDESTAVISKKDISIEEYDTSREIIGREFMMGKGRLKVKEYLIEYIRTNSKGDILARGKLNYEPKSALVDGLWLIFSNEFKDRNPHIDFPVAMHGLEHLITNLTPIHALCDLNDLSGAYFNRHRNLKGNSGIFIFENNEYGVGIVENVYNNMEELLSESLSLLKSCDCHHGCPRCIHSPYCSSENRDLDKNETKKLIEAIQDEKNNLPP